MKLSARDAARYFSRPDKDAAGLLIYGPDAMRIALRRQDVLAALLGPGAEDEMRLTRLSPKELRDDPAALGDAARASGFFPGARAVFLDGAGDGLAGPIGAALEDWEPGDAQIVVTAGQLSPRSKLRKLFEAHPTARAAPVYDEPPSPAELDDILDRAGLRDIPKAVRTEIAVLAEALDPGDLRQTIEKLALYKLSDPDPLSTEDLAAVAPVSIEAGVDDLVTVVAEARASEISPLIRRLQAQGVQPVAICIAAERHFQTLLALAAHPAGPSAAANALRPPIYGPRRDRLIRQAGAWGAARLEQALHRLIETDLGLRGNSPAPPMALVERTLIGLSFGGKR
ncbi:MAG: DNA polymerase III subunit delta [Pseudomonadota bacterium]